MVSEMHGFYQAQENSDTPDAARLRSAASGVSLSSPSSVKGASSSNTPLSNSTGGEDTIHVGLGVQWGPEWERVVKLLRDAKEQAQDPERKSPAIVMVSNTLLVVNPNGRKVGGGSGPFYAFTFDYAGLRFSVMDRPGPVGETPNVRVDMGSLALMNKGAESCYWVACEVVKRMGGAVLWDKLTRLDMCADVLLDCALFEHAHKEQRFILRARKLAMHWDGGRFTGLSIGEGSISCRIYDKLHEVRHDERKMSYLVSNRWGGSVPAHATRVEFQLRRDALKDLGAGSFAEYLQNRAKIALYLTRSWLRVAAGEVDRTHTVGAAVAPEWHSVQKAFDDWTGGALVPVVRKKRVRLKSEGLLRQAAGCLVSAVVRSYDGVLLSPSELYRTCSRFLYSTLSTMDTERAQVNKSLLWHASGPSSLATVTA